MTVALPSLRCETVSPTNSINELPLERRARHERANNLRKEKKLRRNHVASVARSNSSRRLGQLRSIYARRGVSPPLLPVSPPVTQGVNNVSLAGAKRRFVELEPSDPDEYHSDSSDDMSSSSSSFGSSSCSTGSRVKYVQFSSHCAVVEIPHFAEYSSEQKEAMWNGSKKIRSMARINIAEYQFDGWNVETASEEDQFVVVAGVAVHPAHAAAEKKRCNQVLPVSHHRRNVRR
jgi:hypothetical protein